MRARSVLLAAVAAGALSMSGIAFAEGMNSSSTGGSAMSGSSATTTASTMSSGQIRDVQNWLKSAGHDVTVDGQWGNETQQALSDFQRQQGLPVTGQPDSQTMAALQSESNSASTSGGSAAPGADVPAVGAGTSGITGQGGPEAAPSLPGRETDAIRAQEGSNAVRPSTPDSD